MKISENIKRGISCPERWWFRALIYAQFIYVVFSPDHQQWLTALVFIVALYTLRSPDFVVYDDGIQIQIFWQKRFIAFSSIKKVLVTSTQMFISEGVFPFPIFVFRWRKNFKEVSLLLQEKLGDKVVYSSFPIP